MEELKELIAKAWAELIGDVYILYRHSIDSEGWLEVNESDYRFQYNTSIAGRWSGKGYNPLAKGKRTQNKLYVRPKSIDKIMLNNGWTVLNSRDDLPTEEGSFYTVVDTEGRIVEYHYKETEQLKKYWLENFTHYKKVVPLKPPLW
ncbi:hypothetical protein Phi4:1_gp106 [Cellulophaga phage phi4:1]|jgi:hypothetical protein|uniref:Uncharacterized protein n=5 Tax=Lightbulbvirus TaxID=1918522 RepID=A0A0S2MWL2_9CAUD|nr:hypothetical protein Phi4:1_gp106 [Cellulophaga phage phi4:1]YP_008241602.1 hypothetical protein Phi17:2_gp107 [Cellulophaga phage phi17:2]ALO80115.1 hypothetical protein Phi4113_106 [Cellulophaga phage phi4:1_13]ALO80312.1 hypothetical protein Phi4118_106 [Cellulophaga phage phi4:1_18]ALO80510.1 hypothetical protein Phi17218_107 [Cellulophaga phage phi17:2_18]AGO47640.1 hypothetical protein Phi17:2_gp107 [Cellulophaga phage phi17:2]AGO49519.1 hypothetical protein Phi4:1_gp106 [Cellulophag